VTLDYKVFTFIGILIFSLIRCRSSWVTHDLTSPFTCQHAYVSASYNEMLHTAIHWFLTFIYQLQRNWSESVQSTMKA